MIVPPANAGAENVAVTTPSAAAAVTDGAFGSRGNNVTALV
jgi:hypothetical protein